MSEAPGWVGFFSSGDRQRKTPGRRSSIFPPSERFPSSSDTALSKRQESYFFATFAAHCAQFSGRLGLNRTRVNCMDTRRLQTVSILSDLSIAAPFARWCSFGIFFLSTPFFQKNL